MSAYVKLRNPINSPFKDNSVNPQYQAIKLVLDYVCNQFYAVTWFNGHADDLLKGKPKNITIANYVMSKFEALKLYKQADHLWRVAKDKDAKADAYKYREAMRKNLDASVLEIVCVILGGTVDDAKKRSKMGKNARKRLKRKMAEAEFFHELRVEAIAQYQAEAYKHAEDILFENLDKIFEEAFTKVLSGKDKNTSR